MSDLDQLLQLAGDGAIIGGVVSVVVSVAKGVWDFGQDRAAFLVVGLCFLGALGFAIARDEATLATWIKDAMVALAAAKLVWLLFAKRLRNLRDAIAAQEIRDPLAEPATSDDE